MLEGEYPMINNIDGYLYIVPAAGYQNYLNIKNLYDTWEAGKISNDEIVKPGHPLMLGSEAALISKWEHLSLISLIDIVIKL